MASEKRILETLGKNPLVAFDFIRERLGRPTRYAVEASLQKLLDRGKIERIAYMDGGRGRPLYLYAVMGTIPAFLRERCGHCAFYARRGQYCKVLAFSSLDSSRIPAFKRPRLKTAEKATACLFFSQKLKPFLISKEDAVHCPVCGSHIKAEELSFKPSPCATCNSKFRLFPSGAVKVFPDVKQLLKDKLKEVLGYVPKLRKWKTVEVEHWKVPFPYKFPEAFPSETARSIEKTLSERFDVGRAIAYGNALSFIAGTIRLYELFHLEAEVLDRVLDKQKRFLNRIHSAPLRFLIPYEGNVARHYWQIYKTLCESFDWSLQSRKRERLVPGIIFGPRGYSEINAAINFLHRLRLSRACRSDYGRELVGTRGFLHKAKDYGLLLDLIEPLKIIDREFLLLAVKRGQVKKELFEKAEESMGTYFYFPNPAGAFRLEKVGTEADLFEMWYSRKRTTMSEAFDTACKNLIVAMKEKKPYNPLIVEPVGGWKKEVLAKLEISG